MSRGPFCPSGAVGGSSTTTPTTGVKATTTMTAKLTGTTPKTLNPGHTSNGFNLKNPNACTILATIVYNSAVTAEGDNTMTILPGGHIDVNFQGSDVIDSIILKLVQIDTVTAPVVGSGYSDAGATDEALITVNFIKS